MLVPNQAATSKAPRAARVPAAGRLGRVTARTMGKPGRMDEYYTGTYT